MNKITSFPKNIASGLAFYLQTIWTTRKSVFALTAADGILGSLDTYLWIFSFKYLLDYISSAEYQNAGLWIFCCIFVSGLIGLIKDFLNLKKENAYFQINTTLQMKLSELSIKIPFEKIENADTIRQFEMAYKCLGQNCLAAYTNGLANVISSVIVLVGVGVISSALGWWVSLLLLLAIAVNAVCHIFQSQYEMAQFDEETTVGRQLEHTRFWLTEKSRAKEVRSYLLHDFVVSKLKEYNEKYFRVLRRYYKKQKKPYVVAQITGGLQMLAIYAYCAWLLARGTLTIGDFMLHVSALFSFSSSITNVLNALIEVYKNNGYIAKLKGCLALESEATSRVPFAGEFQSIEFRDVSFRYVGEERNALSHVSFVLHKNEKLSLIGENGAGKSTLVKLLSGLYTPTDGEILINGIPYSPEKEDYLSLFSLVFQDYTIFHFTVEENIGMGKTPPEDLCGNLLSELGLGHVSPRSFLSQTFSEDGIELSGGENQKLAIARALCKDSPVIILDEPTSALSPQSEYDIYQKFHRLTLDKAVIFISHRLSSCRICDRILLLHEGSVEAEGTHEELMASSPRYREMFQAQAELYLEPDASF